MQGVAFAAYDVDPSVKLALNGRGLEDDGVLAGSNQFLRACKGVLRVAFGHQIDPFRVLRLGDRLDHKAAIGKEAEIFILIEVRRITALAIIEFGPAVETGLEIGFGEVGAGHEMRISAMTRIELSSRLRPWKPFQRHAVYADCLDTGIFLNYSELMSRTFKSRALAWRKIMGVTIWRHKAGLKELNPQQPVPRPRPARPASKSVKCSHQNEGTGG